MLSRAILRRTSIQGRTFSSLQAVTFEKFGHPSEVLKYHRNEGVESGIAGSQVLVEMLYAPITYKDISIIEGQAVNLPSIGGREIIAGSEGVGRVKAIGNSVKGLKQDQIVTTARYGLGTWTRNAVIDEGDLLPVPNDVPLESLSAIISNASTAYDIFSKYNIMKDDAIILNFANGPLGMPLIQLAKEKGIKSIGILSGSIDYCDTSDKLRAAGCDAVIDENFALSSSFKEIVNEIQPKFGIHAGANELSIRTLLELVKPQGTILSIDGAAPLSDYDNIIQEKKLSVNEASLPEVLSQGFGLDEFNRTVENIKLGALEQKITLIPFDRFESALGIVASRGVDGTLLLKF